MSKAPMSVEEAVKMVRKAIKCLYLEVDASIADDVRMHVERVIAACEAGEYVVKAARRWSRIYQSPTPQNSLAYITACTGVCDMVHEFDKLYPPERGDAEKLVRSDSHLLDTGDEVQRLNERIHALLPYLRHHVACPFEQAAGCTCGLSRLITRRMDPVPSTGDEGEHQRIDPFLCANCVRIGPTICTGDKYLCVDCAPPIPLTGDVCVKCGVRPANRYYNDRVHICEPCYQAIPVPDTEKVKTDPSVEHLKARLAAILDNLDSLNRAAPEMFGFWLKEIKRNATLNCTGISNE